jgi:hypothetical protein
MKTYAHLLSSWRRSRRINSDLLNKNKRTFFNLLKEVHLWLDEFASKKGEGFDYSIFPYDHREARHHSEGIEECVFLFSHKYGQEYTDIIQREASKHVQEDMKYLPQKADYKGKDFWENWSLRYELFTTNC